MDALQKIEPINRLLEQCYGLRVEMSDEKHLREVMEMYAERRKNVLHRIGDDAYSSSEFRKCYLICEAIRIILREVQPKRIRSKRPRA